MLFYGVMLVLPVSALTARRLPIGSAVKAAAAWAAIFAAGLLIVSQRDRFDGIAALFGDQRSVGSETRIRMASDGHFWADARINGVSRRMLIDSGATTTALSSETAATAHVDTDDSPFPTLIETANGTVSARTAAIDRIVVGSVAMDRLGVIVSPAFGDTDVLGMNFLSRVGAWRVEGSVLVIQPKP